LRQQISMVHFLVYQLCWLEVRVRRNQCKQECVFFGTTHQEGRPTSRWSRRGCRRDEIASGWEAALVVVEGAGPEPPRGSAPPLGR
jgi:hypothetical protein